MLRRSKRKQKRQLDNLADLREELEHIEVALGANTYHGAVLRNMHRKAERLAAEIEQLENPKRLTTEEKLVALYERFAQFTATLTSSGIEQLRVGKSKSLQKRSVRSRPLLGHGFDAMARTNCTWKPYWESSVFSSQIRCDLPLAQSNDIKQASGTSRSRFEHSKPRTAERRQHGGLPSCLHHARRQAREQLGRLLCSPKGFNKTPA